jgi:CRISPR/Cas system CMR subunit Cmr4 (Cas7 group RAMP superfamily)
MLELQVTLVSDATFARGGGVSGVVDAEIEHDTATGLPMIRGRTLKGLLVEECANLLALNARVLEPLARELFGAPGSFVDDEGALHVGPAQLDAGFRDAVAQSIDDGQISAQAMLDSMTAIRAQTSIDNDTGTPETGSLRSTRVLLRDITLTAPLMLTTRDEAQRARQIALLCACARAVRRGGLIRNRGRGRLCVELIENNARTTAAFQKFANLLTEGPI